MVVSLAALLSQMYAEVLHRQVWAEAARLVTATRVYQFKEQQARFLPQLSVAQLCLVGFWVEEAVAAQLDEVADRMLASSVNMREEMVVIASALVVADKAIPSGLHADGMAMMSSLLRCIVAMKEGRTSRVEQLKDACL